MSSREKGKEESWFPFRNKSWRDLGKEPLSTWKGDIPWLVLQSGLLDLERESDSDLK